MNVFVVTRKDMRDRPPCNEIHSIWSSKDKAEQMMDEINLHKSNHTIYEIKELEIDKNP